MGCYKDYPGSRDLFNVAFTTESSPSLSSCMKACQVQGFRYAALVRTPTPECRCDVIFGRYGLEEESKCVDQDASFAQRIVRAGNYTQLPVYHRFMLTLQPGYFEVLISRAIPVSCLFRYATSTGKHCPPLPDVRGGRYDHEACYVTGRYTNDQCELSCREGYILDGNGTIYCMETGDWSSAPTCRSEEDAAGLIYIFRIIS